MIRRPEHGGAGTRVARHAGGLMRLMEADEADEADAADAADARSEERIILQSTSIRFQCVVRDFLVLLALQLVGSIRVARTRTPGSARYA